MKKLFAIVLCLLAFCGCAKETSVQTPNTNPPTIMVEGVLYTSTGKQMPVEVDESAILGTIESVVHGSEFPTENGQANFPCEGAEYARISDSVHEGIIVLIDHEWTYFEVRE